MANAELKPEQQSDAIEFAIARACSRIAPTWPLDQSIAVNPWWQFKDQPYAKTASELSLLANVKGYAPAAFYQKAYADGEITDQSLARAGKRLGVNMPSAQLVSQLKAQNDTPTLTLFSVTVDSAQADQFRGRNAMRWQEEIVHQISQFCAAHFQSLRPMLGRKQGAGGQNSALYGHWLEVTRVDYGLSIVLSAPKLRRLLQELPTKANHAIAFVIKEMELKQKDIEQFALACLYDIHGWASWVAYRQWQSHTPTGDPYYATNVNANEMRELLAIRMAWEWLVFTYLKRYSESLFRRSLHDFRGLWQRKPELQAAHQARLFTLQVWSLAQEIEYQRNVERLLTAKKAEPDHAETPWLQAVFCIDVRSEVMRRALEQQHAGIETKGFAGFFGVPLAYQPKGTPFVRSHTPGLLSPALTVAEVLAEPEIEARLQKLNRKARMQTWSYAAPSAFSMVESMGLLYLPKLLKGRVLGHVVNDLSHASEWTINDMSVANESDEVSLEKLTDIAASVLTAMSFDNFAPLVLLVGHSSESQNNLQAAALDCGACCGQSGEVNARVLAQILNHVEVRAGLKARGFSIPEHTEFVAAVHNTTTDQIRLLSPHREDREENTPLPLAHVFEKAQEVAQSERITYFEPENAHLSAEQKRQLMQARAQDWAQQRPEWGLANNAAFIIAPRTWSKGVNLSGRAFLHDYQAHLDPNQKVLELLMTAPMVVAHWINMQYNLSVCDPIKFGSGNKVLHNAVGGSIGVFEGNGGDLRIGLAQQSVFKGEQCLHTPQRLTVIIAAEQAAIAQVVAQHEVLQQLINNDWLHVLQWQQNGGFTCFYRDQWQQTQIQNEGV